MERGFLGFGQLQGHLGEVVRGASAAFMVKAAGAGVGFLFNLVLARTLTVEATGVYFLAVTIMTIGGMLAQLGFGSTLVRLVAASASIQEWGTIRGLHRYSVTVVTLASLITSLALFTAAGPLAHSVFGKPDLEDAIRWMSLGLPPFALLTIYSELLRGLKQVVLSQVILVLSVPVVSVGTLLFIGDRLGALSAVWASVVALTFTLVLAVLCWRSARKPHRAVRAKRVDTRKIFAIAMPVLGIGMMSVIIRWAPLLILGAVSTRAAAGVFGLAVRIAAVAQLFLFAINVIAAPKFAELHHQGRHDELAQTYLDSTRLLRLSAIPLLLGFLSAPWWMGPVFGPEFSAAGTLLQILGVGHFVTLAVGPAASLLLMSGREKVLSLTVFGAGFASLVAHLICIPIWGAPAAAFVTAASLVLERIVFSVLIRPQLGFSRSERPEEPVSPGQG